MAEKMPIDEAMRFAGVAAALKCLSFGGSLGVPDRAAVERYLTKL
jgi:sulfofructose kinase